MMICFKPDSTLQAAIRFFAACLAVSLLFASACLPAIEPPPPASVSLLTLTPYIGDEISIRENSPQPERWDRMQESVEGWMSPSPEGKLRFPVEIREGARLSFRMGAETTVPIREGVLSFIVEYFPDEPIETAESTVEGPILLYETAPERNPEIFLDWEHVDLSLADCGSGKGELIFRMGETLAGDPGITFMWGHPAVYHPPELKNRNVILIGVDTLRADSVTPYGAAPEITPVLQNFSRTSTTFMQCRAQSSWTLPSFSSMITGALPSTISATVYTGHLPERHTTIAEYLRDRGYGTHAVCSNAWMGNPQSGFHQGFDSLWFESNEVAPVSVEESIEFIEHNITRDWFLFLHFMDPHTPYSPPDEFVDLLTDPDYTGEIGMEFESVDSWKDGSYIPPVEDQQHVRNLYNGEVANVDAALGELFDFLETNNLDENTLVIFSSDHGEEFYDHGGFEHGHTQLDELVRMPLIVRGPGFQEDVRIDTSVGNTDIFPTICSFLEIPVMNEFVGLPLQDVVSGSVAGDRLIFGEGNTRGTLRKFAVSWPWKCILDFVTGETRLFNLEFDPDEKQDLSAAEPEIIDRLRTEIVVAMRPSQTAFHVWITRSYLEEPATFNGTIRFPGGFDSVDAFLLGEDDEYSIEGDTITFEITSSLQLLGPNKHLLIRPSRDSTILEATLLVNGRAEPERFYPYGTRTPEPSGSAVISIYDFPLGTTLPYAIEDHPASCYIWGVQGYDHEDEVVDLDEKTIEQLRALGYAQ